MKFLDELYDHVLDKSYKLYRMNAKEISERLKRSYNLSPMVYQLFNSESNLLKAINRIKHSRKNHRSIHDHERNDLKKAIREVKASELSKGMTEKGIHFGYEMMPIAISATGDIENPETKIELVDGFKRMFCINEVPEMDILVKVYDSFNDRDWINSMIIYNSWKFVDGEGSSKYMDRGFQLGLYHRYNILFLKMQIIGSERGIFSLINLYTSGKDLNIYSTKSTSQPSYTYSTFWNNNQFYDDIKAIYEMVNARPTFELKKKGEMLQYHTSGFERTNRDGYRGISRIVEIFISILGEIRRYELTEGIQERVVFNRQIFEDYWKEPSLQKVFVKIHGMSVDGHIVNYISKNLREDIKKRMYEGMGYSYEPVKPEATKEPMRFNLTEISF